MSGALASPARRGPGPGRCCAGVAPALALLAGCSMLEPAAPVASAPVASTPPPDPIRVEPPLALPGEVDVRLAALSGSAALVVEGAREGSVELRAEGTAVVDAAGRRAERVELRAREPAGLCLAGSLYPGVLIVEAGARGLEVTSRVPLEEYVTGVVAAELSLWSAEPAELEAQAIAARTYAVRRLEHARSLVDGTGDQVYRGRFRAGSSAGARRVAAELERAVRATRGCVLVLEGKPIDARFHAACGGRTARIEDVFSRSAVAGRGPLPVDCDPCRARVEAELGRGEVDRRGPLAWSWTASSEDLGRAASRLGLGERLLRFSPARIDAGGRWLEVTLEGARATRRISFEELRAVLGPDDLKSARIARTWPRPGSAIEGGLAFQGVGRGHGVGLCQEGARDYARRGWSAERILAHYYPGSRVACGG